MIKKKVSNKMGSYERGIGRGGAQFREGMKIPDFRKGKGGKGQTPCALPYVSGEWYDRLESGGKKT